MVAGLGPELLATMTALQELEPDVDFRSIERETRILPREIYVLLTDHGFKVPDKDAAVRRYCKKRDRAMDSQDPNSRISSFICRKTRKPAPSSTKPPSHLPYEIIFQILSYFTAADAVRSEDGSYRKYCSLCHLKHLYTFSLISKAWNIVATELLYSNLKLDLDGTCEYHWRGIPWSDGKLWWARRHSYLKDRYLKPLLRTLTARPDLADWFRTVEIDVHNHMESDYKVLPLYTKLITLCPNITSILGDPCILFSRYRHPPSRRVTLSRCFDVCLTGGYVRRRTIARIRKHQEELQYVLLNRTNWESWGVDGCQISPPFLSSKWTNLKHLSFKNYLLYFEVFPSLTSLPSPPPLASLVSLVSLSLTNTTLRILSLVPDNQLTTLKIENPDSYFPNWTSISLLDELWTYLSRGRGANSKLKHLSISIPAYHAPLTKEWLGKTLSLVPNLRELHLSPHYDTARNYIVLKSDSDLEEYALRQAAFPICKQLQTLRYLFPGWTHNELLVELLAKEGMFPALRGLMCFRSGAVAELADAVDWHPLEEQTLKQSRETCREKGAEVDKELKVVLERRGMGWVRDSTIDWRKVRYGLGC